MREAAPPHPFPSGVSERISISARHETKIELKIGFDMGRCIRCTSLHIERVLLDGLEPFPVVCGMRPSEGCGGREPSGRYYFRILTKSCTTAISSRLKSNLI